MTTNQCDLDVLQDRSAIRMFPEFTILEPEQKWIAIKDGDVFEFEYNGGHFTVPAELTGATIRLKYPIIGSNSTNMATQYTPTGKLLRKQTADKAPSRTKGKQHKSNARKAAKRRK